jgi:hypothetical protein
MGMEFVVVVVVVVGNGVVFGAVAGAAIGVK